MTVNGKELTVKDVMRPCTTIASDQTYREVLDTMITEKTNSLLAVDGVGTLVGIVDPVTLIKAVVPDYLVGDEQTAHFASEEMLREEVEKVSDRPVGEFTNTEVSTVGPDENLMKVAVMAMTKGNMRLPVVDEQGKPVGLLTRTELKQVIGSYLGIDGCFSG